MKKRIAELEKQLQDAQHAAQTGILCMLSAAHLLEVMRDVKWMQEVDPTGNGPKFLCDSEAKHLNRVAGELQERLPK